MAAVVVADSMAAADSMAVDSMAVDSMAVDSMGADSMAAVSMAAAAVSMAAAVAVDASGTVNGGPMAWVRAGGGITEPGRGPATNTLNRGSFARTRRE